MEFFAIELCHKVLPQSFAMKLAIKFATNFAIKFKVFHKFCVKFAPLDDR